MSRRDPSTVPPGAALTLALTLAWVPAGAAEPKKAEGLTVPGVAGRLKGRPSGAEAEALADDLRRWFGAGNLAKGPNPKVAGTSVAWAVEAPGASAPPRVVSEGGPALDLERVGTTDVYARVETYPEGYAARWNFEVDGKALPHPGAGPRRRPGPAQLEVYTDPPEAVAAPGVPRGTLSPQPKWRSKVFEGTTRDWWVYTPARADGGRPAAVMVFQDGGGYKDFVPAVFDNLIAAGGMPPAVAVFVNPGTFDDGRSNRSFEYDTLSDQYARFLLDEILPAAEAAAKVKLRRDPAGRAVAGISSGGICAWTVAWERPGEFSKVLSWVGSFTNIASGKTGREGGHNYEAMVRKTPKKPIRVFLQDGANDLDNANGNWPLANQQMAKSLEFARYDYKFVFGQGFHSNAHGRAILPDSLRWLWRGWEAEQPK